MPRRIEIRKFEKPNGELGLSVDVYCRERDNKDSKEDKRILKSRIFSAVENKGHYLLRVYDVRASFLETQRDSNYDNIQIGHDLMVVEAEITRQARDCLAEFEESYAFMEDEKEAR